MSVHRVLAFVRRWILLLLAGPVLGGAAGFLALTRIPPVYEATALLQVNPGSVAVGGSAMTEELRGAEQLARTYAEAMRTRAVLEQAAAQVGLTVPYRELERRVSTRPLRDTQLLRVSTEDTDPVVAAHFANAIAEVFRVRNLEAQAGRFASSRESLGRFLDSLRSDLDARQRDLERLRTQPASPNRDAEIARLQSDVAQLQATYGASVRSFEELRVNEARSINSLTVLQPAVIPETPVRPSRGLTLLGAVLAGLALASAAAFAAEYLDDALRDRERVARATGLVTLGVVPESEGRREGGALATRRVADSYRLLVSSLFALAEAPLRTLMITSAGAGEGKSTTATGLAIILAQAGQRVILVDADLYRPTQMRAFNLSNRVGFATLLLQPSEPAASMLQASSVPGLSVLTAGAAPPDPSALFSSRRLADRMAELHTLCDVLIFDTPPLLAQPDAAILGAHVDATLLVVDASKSRGRQVARALEILRNAGVPVAGVVMNRVSEKALDYVQYGYAGYGAAVDEAGGTAARPGTAAAPPQGVPS